MLITESLTDFAELLDLHESLCQEMYNDLNEGKPCPVLRYYFLKETLSFYEEDPLPDYVVQLMITGTLKRQLREANKESHMQALKILSEN